VGYGATRIATPVKVAYTRARPVLPGRCKLYKIVATINHPDADESYRRALRLTAAAEQLGFQVVYSKPVLQPAAVPDELAQHYKDPQSYAHVRDSGITALQELCAFTAYDTWKMFGGLPATDSEGRVRRAKGKVFTTICRLMATNNLRFTDISPRDFAHYSKHAWEAQGADRPLAAALEGVEIFDAKILCSLTDSDIDTILCGPFLQEGMTLLRNELRIV
jgi:hypothetical protein